MTPISAAEYEQAFRRALSEKFGAEPTADEVLQVVLAALKQLHLRVQELEHSKAASER